MRRDFVVSVRLPAAIAVRLPELPTPKLVSRLGRGADFANLWFSGVALLKESRDFSLGKMFPAFGIAKIFPTLLWMKYGLLSAQQSHCTVASNVFHCHLPKTRVTLYPP